MKSFRQWCEENPELAPPPKSGMLYDDWFSAFADSLAFYTEHVLRETLEAKETPD